MVSGHLFKLDDFRCVRNEGLSNFLSAGLHGNELYLEVL